MDKNTEVMLVITLEEAQTISELMGSYEKIFKLVPCRGFKKLEMRQAIDGINKIKQKVKKLVETAESTT